MHHLLATVEDWDRLLAVNAKGAFLCYKHAAAYMIQQGKGGRIIGACSATGKRGQSSSYVNAPGEVGLTYDVQPGAPFLAAYSAAKFAVRGLTQVSGEYIAMYASRYSLTTNAAQELHPHSITVNCYAPSFIKTELSKPSHEVHVSGKKSLSAMSSRSP